MNTSCATSSRRVMVLIHRLTVGEDLMGGRGGVGFTGVDASAAKASSRQAQYFRDEAASFRVRGRFRTLPVCQIQRVPARFCGVVESCLAGGLRGAARLIRRFTQFKRCTGSRELLAITTSAPVPCSFR